MSGKLFKIILNYVNNVPIVFEDPILEIIFEPIKVQLDADYTRWQNIVERNSKNGSKGGRPKTQSNPKNPLGFLVTQSNPNEPKKANINNNYDINNNSIDKDILSSSISEIFNYWQLKMNSPAKLDDRRKNKIKQALKTYSLAEIKLAIDGCFLSDWHMGRDPKTSGKKFNMIDLICRDSEKIDSFIQMTKSKLTKSHHFHNMGDFSKRDINDVVRPIRVLRGNENA